MEQQEREYRESEERDRAMIAERRRQQKLQEEETIRRNKEQQERMEKNAKRLKVVKHLRGELIANHAADDYDGKDSIRVLVRYPSGETSQHRFSPDENTQSLFGVIFAKPCCPDYFEAHYGFPRRRLDFYPEGYHVLLMDLRQSLGLEKLSYVEPRTFREFGINSSLTLYISDIDS
uniref:UBX domain-containing protein n=1 Tax=Angiostrongylus cantonensis TaxID=6313 RepID=A0A0K0DNF8_ANGCA